MQRSSHPTVILKPDTATLRTIHEAYKQNQLSIPNQLVQLFGPKANLHSLTISLACSHCGLNNSDELLSLELEEAAAIFGLLYTVPLQDMQNWQIFINALRNEVLASVANDFQHLTFGQFRSIIYSGLYLSPVSLAEHFQCPTNQYIVDYFKGSPFWMKFGIHEFNDLYCISKETQQQLDQFNDITFADLNTKLSQYGHIPINFDIEAWLTPILQHDELFASLSAPIETPVNTDTAKSGQKRSHENQATPQVEQPKRKVYPKFFCHGIRLFTVVDKDKVTINQEPSQATNKPSSPT